MDASTISCDFRWSRPMSWSTEVVLDASLGQIGPDSPKCQKTCANDRRQEELLRQPVQHGPWKYLVRDVKAFATPHLEPEVWSPAATIRPEHALCTFKHPSKITRFFWQCLPCMTVTSWLQFLGGQCLFGHNIASTSYMNCHNKLRHGPTQRAIFFS